MIMIWRYSQGLLRTSIELNIGTVFVIYAVHSVGDKITKLRQWGARERIVRVVRDLG